MKIVHLQDRGLIEIRGSESETLLQRIITNDMKKLSDDNGLYSLLLTPRGKFSYDFFIFKMNDSIFIDVHKDQLEDLYIKIKSLRINESLKLRNSSRYHIYAAFGEKPSKSNFASIQHCYKDPRHTDMGYRFISPDLLSLPNDYGHMCDDIRMKCLIPDGCLDIMTEERFPFEYGLDKFNSIDHDKGCYIGQEVVSRMRFKSRPNRCLYLLDIKYDEKLFGSAGDFTLNGNKIGYVKHVYYQLDCGKKSARAMVSLRINDVGRINEDCELRYLDQPVVILNPDAGSVI